MLSPVAGGLSVAKMISDSSNFGSSSEMMESFEKVINTNREFLLITFLLQKNVDFVPSNFHFDIDNNKFIFIDTEPCGRALREPSSMTNILLDCAFDQ